jgi:hypothetical protein
MNWCGLMVLSGLAAVVFAVTGLTLWFVASTAPGLAARALDTVLIVAAFPLLFLMAHAMDRFGETQRAIRREYERRTRSNDRSA